MGKAQYATIEQLLKKPVRVKTIELSIPGDDGEPQKVSVKLKAIGSSAYDDLLGKYPPTPKQKKDGATYNPDTFAPALVAACLTEPRMDLEDVQNIWTSDEWSRGELTELFIAAVQINQAGLDIPFTDNG
jgi:hypothetical protein